MPNSVLQNKRILITAGPLRAPIDAVRFISNTSTGALGTFLAAEALRRGALVTLVCGPGSLRPAIEGLRDGSGERLTIIPVITFDDLMRTLSQELGRRTYRVVLHAMAVLDYVPETGLEAKIPSGQDRWTVTLVPTPKIIQMIKRWDPDLFLVGFKLEVGADRKKLIEQAHQLAMKSGADLVVANELRETQGKRHRALVVGADGRVLGDYSGKEQIASGLLDLVERRLKGEE